MTTPKILAYDNLVEFLERRLSEIYHDRKLHPTRTSGVDVLQEVMDWADTNAIDVGEVFKLATQKQSKSYRTLGRGTCAEGGTDEGREF